MAFLHGYAIEPLVINGNYEMPGFSVPREVFPHKSFGDLSCESNESSNLFRWMPWTDRCKLTYVYFSTSCRHRICKIMWFSFSFFCFIIFRLMPFSLNCLSFNQRLKIHIFCVFCIEVNEFHIYFHCLSSVIFFAHFNLHLQVNIFLQLLKW